MSEKKLRAAARAEERAVKAKAGNCVPYDLETMTRAHEAATADKLPDDQLQALLDQHRAGDDVRKAMAKALTYLAYDGCLSLDTAWPYSYLADHMMAIGVCIDRLASNEIPATDIERYVGNEFRPGRHKGKHEHKVKLPRREREGLNDDAEEVADWLDVEALELDEQDREVAKLYLRDRRPVREVADILGITVHAVRMSLEQIKRAAA